nr:tyrosine-protein phosphatase [Gordonia phthalatica]
MPCRAPLGRPFRHECRADAEGRPSRARCHHRRRRRDGVGAARRLGGLARDVPETFVDNPGARQAYKKMLDAVLTTAEAGHTTLINCSAGRDRTGWAAAVILRMLDVDMTVIEADFTAGNMGVDVRWLRGAFAHATALYGGFDNYLTKGLGFSPAKQQRLRAALTS